MIKLVINAGFLAPGGGLTVLTGLLGGWRDVGAGLDITVFVRRESSIRLLERSGWGDLIQRIPAGNKLETVWWQRTRLPRLLRELGADVFFNNNIYVPGAPCPELVHHNNLWTLHSRRLIAHARRGPSSLVNALAARRALARASANVFISEFLRGRGETIDPSSSPRNHVIYNGLPQEFLDEAHRPATAEEPPTRLCAVQSPYPHKDNESLLAGFAELVRRRPDRDWSLEIAGDGDWGPWKSMASRLGIVGRTRFLQHLDLPSLKRLYASSGCLIYPSVFEGFGMPVIEAMAVGCPVVAVEATAIPEVAADAAILVPPRSPAEIAGAVERLYADRELRAELVRKGKRRALRFPWRESARAFHEIFRRLAARKSG